MVCQEPPWPTTHGGRVDVWNRYDGLVREGWTAGVVCWADATDAQARADADAGFKGVFHWVRLLPKPTGAAALVKRLGRLVRQPSLTTAMHLEPVAFRALVADARRFSPDVVIADSVHTADFTRRIAKALNIPLIVRSHNVEHLYMATQYKLASSWRLRLSIAAARLHLKAYETDALRRADHVLEISCDAIPFWREHGVERIDWIPTFLPGFDEVGKRSIPWSERRYDAVYLGNLWSPNNVSAVRWLLDEVMPHVRRLEPRFRLMVAGSNPSPDLQVHLERVENVQWLANPSDADALRALGRVLVNPILEGSGLNTKSVELLFCDSPLVMTPFAADGMDAKTRSCFNLHSNPEDFAAAMVGYAAKPFRIDHARVEARERFGAAAARKLSMILADVAARGASDTSRSS